MISLVFQGKKRFDIDPPRGPFGTKVRMLQPLRDHDGNVTGCTFCIHGILFDVASFTIS